MSETPHMIGAIAQARATLERFATMALLHKINETDINDANEAMMGIAAVESVLLDVAESAKWLLEGKRD